jgi:hypothetical protein
MIAQQELSKIKSKIEEKELITEETLKQIKDLINKNSTDILKFSKSFIKCYDILKGNALSLDYSEEFKKLLNNLEIDKIRSYLESYNGGDSIGDHYILEDIKDFNSKKRKEMEEIIEIFLYLFND